MANARCGCVALRTEGEDDKNEAMERTVKEGSRLDCRSVEIAAELKGLV